MAKVSFKNLGLKVNQDVTIMEFNGQQIEVKQYLPVADKLEFIGRVVSFMANDDNNFDNPLKREVYFNLELLYTYTNINFTDKLKEDHTKLFDMLNCSGLLGQVIACIPSDEYQNLVVATYNTIQAYYQYRSSALGIMDSISADYTNISMEGEELNRKFADPNTLGLVKDIVTKLG